MTSDRKPFPWRPAPARLAWLLLLPLLALALGGCAALPRGALTNRITVTMALDECQVASRWGVFSIGSDIDARDCVALTDTLRLRVLLEARERSAPPQSTDRARFGVPGAAALTAATPL
ncbi:MAG: hypothetical protein AMXMBFR78_34020 [Rubrivivax sp.]